MTKDELIRVYDKLDIKGKEFLGQLVEFTERSMEPVTKGSRGTKARDKAIRRKGEKLENIEKLNKRLFDEIEKSMRYIDKGNFFSANDLEALIRYYDNSLSDAVYSVYAYAYNMGRKENQLED